MARTTKKQRAALSAHALKMAEISFANWTISSARYGWLEAEIYEWLLVWVRGEYL